MTIGSLHERRLLQVQLRREPIKMLIRTLMATLFILLLTAAVFAQDNPPKTANPQSEAKKAFEKLKTLAGSWQGNDYGHTDQLHNSRRIQWYRNSA